MLFRLRAIDKLPEPRTYAQLKGILTHTVLEQLFRLPPAERTVEQAISMVRPAVDDAVPPDDELVQLVAQAGGVEKLVDDVSGLVRTDFDLEDPRRLTPQALELWVQATIGGRRGAPTMKVRGYIDRLDVAPGTGALRIVDYKTGKAPGPSHNYEALFQLRCYALALWRSDGTVPAMLQLLYLAGGAVRREEPNVAGLERTEARLLALWSGIVRCARTGEWPAAPGPLCPWCYFKPRCPAFGGAAPLPPPDLLERLGLEEEE